ncbi:MAG: hypothetical protein IPK19_05570 [Chloroflexi bacterium]|nr:hypothetical protein [Chloroflexota bacterium]
MAYRVEWIVQDRVLYMREYDAVQLEDIRDISQRAADLLEAAYRSGARLVIGIVDLSDARFETSLPLFRHGLEEIAAAVDPRMWKAKPGFVVLITTTEAARDITSFVISTSKQPLTTVETLDEALLVVRYMYPELQAQLDAYRDRHLSLGNAN